MYRLTSLIAGLVAVAALAATPLGAQQRERGETRVPRGYEPPAGMCRIWLEGVPANQQPAPTDCATAIRRRPGNASVVFGEPVRGSNERRSPVVRPLVPERDAPPARRVTPRRDDTPKRQEPPREERTRKEEPQRERATPQRRKAEERRPPEQRAAPAEQRGRQRTRSSRPPVANY